MHDFLVSAAAFIVLVGAIIVVHEGGHFALAKLCRVRVEAFSIGFGPRLFGFKIGDTEYKLCLLPLGGFVKMTGETESGLTGSPSDGQEPVDDPGAFTAHPRWQRMLIGLAGPTFNFLLTLSLMWFYFAFINEVPAATVKTTSVEWVTPGSAAATAGIETGDVIVGFDNIKNPDWENVYDHIRLNANQVVPVAVERGGNTLQLSLRVPASAKSDDFDLSDAGISPQYLPGRLRWRRFSRGCPPNKPGCTEAMPLKLSTARRSIP
jgi:regulator of sigma E protease